MLYSSPSVYILTTAPMCNGGLSTRENAIPIQCLQRKSTFLIWRTFVIWGDDTRPSAMNRQKYYWFHIKPTNIPWSQLLCWHSTLKLWQIPICEAHSAPARPCRISGDSTCHSNAPDIISSARHLRCRDDRVGAGTKHCPLLNVINIPVFSCSCQHQSSIIVMPLPLIPQSICIMLMTNINCFLIIMNQKYGKDLPEEK